MLVLLPCYSLEDFSLNRPSDEADEIFAAWTSLFHPLLLEHEAALPEWEPAGSPNTSRTYSLVVVPPTCESLVPQEAMAKLEESEAILIRGCSTRQAIVKEILHRIGKEDATFDADLVDSFYSLGLAYFISDLLTRKLRYMSDIDSTELERVFLAAVKAYRENNGDIQATHDELQKGFDLVCQATEYYFPSPARFVDLTRLSPEDGPDSLLRMLKRRAQRGEKTNLLPDVDFISSAASRYPRTIDFLRKEIAQGRVELLCADEGEHSLYLMPQTDILRRLRQGRDELSAFLGKTPRYFGRYRAGLTPVLPQLLRLTGFKASLLFTLDGWTTDYKNQTRVNWKDRSGTMLPTLAKSPVDAEDTSAFMELLDDLGYAWHSDDVMTSVYSHRPDREVLWWGDMARTNRFTPIIAEFNGLSEYIELTKTAGQTKLLKKDDFRTNALTRASKNDQADPVSQWNRYYSDYFAALASRCQTVMELDPKADEIPAGGEVPPNTALFTNVSLFPKTVIAPGRPESVPPEFARHVLVVSHVNDRTETLLELPPMSRVCLRFENVPVEVKENRKKKKKKGKNDPSPQSQSVVKTGFWTGLKQKWFGSSQAGPVEPRMVELIDNARARDEGGAYYVMRNGQMELRVDRSTGVVKRLSTLNDPSGIEFSKGLLRRPGFGNRFSWQLALKMSKLQCQCDGRDRQSGHYGYTIMAADKFRILSTGPVEGCLKVIGRLVLPDGTSIAKYEQTLTMRRNYPVIDVEITFQPKELPTEHSWDNYFGCRFAWKDTFAEVRAGVHEMLWKSDRDFLQAPECVDIRSEENIGMTILSNGYPFYRLQGSTRIDSILIPKNESQRTFRFGVGVDLPDPMASALGFFGPVPQVVSPKNQPQEHFRRFFDLESHTGGALPIDVEPVYNTDTCGSDLPDNPVKTDRTRPDGFRLTLLEREATSSSVQLRFCSEVEQLEVADLTGGTPDELSVSQDGQTVSDPPTPSGPAGQTASETTQSESLDSASTDDSESDIEKAESKNGNTETGTTSDTDTDDTDTDDTDTDDTETESETESEADKAAKSLPVTQRIDNQTFSVNLKRNELLPLDIRFGKIGSTGE
ncbi:MAG: hypothetical protein PHQ75_02460 [Thermoguttaceae bacterium]|nr:hypothetical protein [Thermoguttaceae bacterium]